MNNLYCRNIKFPLKSIIFTKKDIPVRGGKKLNFYQKHIILLLNNKVSAKSNEELCIKISTMLNIKLEMVSVFIEKLNKLKLISVADNHYYLNEESKFKFDDKDKRILLSNVAFGKDDLDFIYFPDIRSIFTVNLAEKSEFTSTKKEEKKLLEEVKKLYVSELAKIVLEGKVQNVTKRSLKHSVINPIEFNIEDLESVFECNYNIPVEIFYNYDYGLERGIFSEVNINVSDEYIEYFDLNLLSRVIKDNYYEDKKKPDFVLYEEQIKLKKESIEKIKKINEEISNISEKRETLSVEIETKNSHLAQMKKEIKSKEKELKNLKQKEESTDKISKELELHVQELKKTDDEVNRTNFEIKELKKEILEKETLEKAERVQVEAIDNKIYIDAFEKKIKKFMDKNQKGQSYPKIFARNNIISDVMLEMSKRINDKADMKDQFEILRGIFQNYIRVIIVTYLGKKTSSMDKLKSLLNDKINRIDLLSSNLSTMSALNNMIELEMCCDYVFHHKDKTKKAEYEAEYNKFIDLSSEGKKEKLESILILFENLELTEQKLKEIEENL